MYLRRLRTLMDQLTGGQLASVSINASIGYVHGVEYCGCSKGAKQSCTAAMLFASTLAIEGRS